MALTKTDICNLALSEIGESRNQLTDFDTDTDSIAVQCQLHYPRAIDELVRMHSWNCCINRDQLTTSAYTEHGWDYYSALPTGCLRVLSMTDIDTTWRDINYRIQWAVEAGNVLVNYEDPYITYMAEPTLANMDSLFIRALYTLLASKLAVPLKGDNGRDLRNQLQNELIMSILPEARSIDSFEDDGIEPLDSDYISATYSNYYLYDYPFNQAL